MGATEGVTIGAQLRESGRSFGSVFANPGLRRLNLAFAASVVGDWAYAVAMSVWAYQHGGAAAVGLFGVGRYATMAILGPLLSTLADRHRRTHVMIGADLVRAIVVVIGAAAIAFDWSAAIVYGAGLLTAAVGLAFRPAQAALLPQLATDPRELTSANVVASTIEGVGFFMGPLVAGVLLAVADIAVVYLANAATFVVSALLLAGLRGTADPAPAAPEGAAAEPAAVDAEAVEVDADPDAASPATAGVLRESVEGFRTIAASRELRIITVLFTAQTVVAGASIVFEVSIALDLLDLGDSGVGLLGTFLGIGGIIGGFVALVVAAREHIATDFGVGVLLWSAPLLLIVAVPSLASTLVAMFIIGLANALVDINAYTIIQRLAPTEVMGRVFGALESVLTVGMAIGALVMPLLIELVGLRVALAVIGGTVAAIALVGLASLRRIDHQVLAPRGVALLRGVPTLSVLPSRVLERLARALVTMTVPAGTTVIRQGDPGDRFWIIQRGTAIVTVDGEEVGRLGAGDGFGEIALLRDVPRMATVRAGDDELVLQGLDRDDFIPAVTGHGEARDAADATIDRWLAIR